MLEAFGLSDPGCVRANNEDYFISDTDAGVFVLADGMGGANAGECASRLSAEILYSYMIDPGVAGGLDKLDQAFREANWAVRDAADSKPELEGMGTTLVVARDIGESRLQIGRAGDSRAYLVSQGELSQLTHDQTWVAEVGSRLGLTEEDLKKHPMRHVLTMAVGSSEDLRLSTCIVELQQGDHVLLCSDGLHGLVSEKILIETVESEKTLPEKCHYLVDAAKNEGGPDNITVVLIRLV